MQGNRPVHLDLLKIKLPVAGMLSIMHRLSGMVLALSMPIVLYLFDLSLKDNNNFIYVKELLHSLPVKIVFILLLWALMHHLLAGIRFLFLDADIGIEKPEYRISAWIVLLLAPVIAVLLGVSL